MKKYFLFITVILILVSCQEDVTFNNPSIQGMKDNVFWRAVQSKATLGPNGSLVIEAYTRNEILSLKVTSTKTQSYILGTSESRKAVYVVTDAAGAITTFSTGIGIGDGQIVITEYDDVNKTVTGTFRFNAKNISNNSSASPILNFQNGVFYKVPVN